MKTFRRMQYRLNEYNTNKKEIVIPIGEQDAPVDKVNALIKKIFGNRSKKKLYFFSEAESIIITETAWAREGKKELEEEREGC